MDCEIIKTQSHLPELSTQSSPAHLLPAELLTRIFFINAYHPFAPSDCTSHGGKPHLLLIPSHLRDTINASQVCRRWHIITTSAPELWNHCIDPHHPCTEWTDLLVERSGPLGIAYMFTEPSEPDRLSESLAREMKHAERLTHYCFRHTAPLVDLPRSWPQLRHLCIVSRRDDDSDSPQISDEPCPVLPEDFPGSWTPNLERLHFHDYLPVSRLSQIVALRSTLTHLHITHPHRCYSWDGWLAVIHCLPHLKSLVLLNAVSSQTTHGPKLKTSQPLVLQLEEFTLAADVVVCRQALTQLDLSHTSRAFSLSGYVEQHSCHCVGELIPQLSPIFNNLCKNPLFGSCALGLDSSAIKVVGLGGYPNERGLPEADPRDPEFDGGFVLVSLETLGVEEHLRGDWYRSILMELQPLLGQVEKISLGNTPGGVETTTLVLSETPRVRQLQSVKLSGWEVLYQMGGSQVVEDPRVKPDITSPSTLRFPALETVELNMDPSEPEYPHQQVTHFCEFRDHHGYPLRVITSPWYAGYLSLSRSLASFGEEDIQAIADFWGDLTE